MPPDPDLLDLLGRQDGLISVEQPGRVDLPARTLRRRVRDDGWSRIAPRVVAGGHTFTPRVRVRTAALWAGERAVVSGPAAAWWLGMLATAPRTVEVTVPRTTGLRARPGISVRRRDLDSTDAVRRAGIRPAALHLARPGEPARPRRGGDPRSAPGERARHMIASWVHQRPKPAGIAPKRRSWAVVISGDQRRTLIRTQLAASTSTARTAR